MHNSSYYSVNALKPLIGLLEDIVYSLKALEKKRNREEVKFPEKYFLTVLIDRLTQRVNR
ncbi:MAG TPA: hypothetical protein DCQ51_00060 [Planktothrix sp. UBA8407]|jgi:hypothetical protein|nr:hypothetical protein [Planktothrix sp. UBA8407]HBK22164.1 hypothetical protein [Planktothrix sp. UBA10369]